MQWLGDALRSVLEGDALPFEGLGSLIALALIVALRLLLPYSQRELIRWPFRLLVAHFACVAVVAVTPLGSGLNRLAQLSALLMLLTCLGRAGFVLVLDSLLARRWARPFPKIFRDILEGLVYVTAVLATLRAAGAELSALLTTSALLTAVVGLSLQDTLGNLFAGLSIQAQHPFEVGDWIQFDEKPSVVGRVVEINWRATRVITLDQVEIVIPNGPLAKAPIRNFTKPTPVSRRGLRLTVPRDVAPHRVRAAIEAGLHETDGVLLEPSPDVLTEAFTDFGMQYWVRYFIDDYEARERVDSAARERIWVALRRAGIPLARPVQDVAVHPEDEQQRKRTEREALAERLRALRRVDICRALQQEQQEQLAQATELRPYAPGELVIRQGEHGDELFIVLRGQVVVTVDEKHHTPRGDSVEVARLGPGSFFGEMSLMTGAPRNANVRTLVDTELLVVGKAALAPILDASPELAERISEALATRQQEIDSASSKSAARKVGDGVDGERSGQLLGKIREFFSL
ncbi:mechanosensitive ion channel family protein [Paraliomyxa miuraensis]|uniref:mechanosensitive ion channel family protein n=1 Tax=Paraliomyxa miuraensis TaxID=376150 RepID=UPI002257EF12|nr:mechanosensitive ion channel family protein [Paraliomyxa miuraensis]MCX4243558.1 mechanosensitive ion channel family protein [Paraliomyxa miuraensis]